MKTECWSCGNYARMPLSYRHWCDDCEREVANRTSIKTAIIDELLNEILNGEASD